jgi:hypothetical protein
LKGTKADRTFNAIGALATIAFAYNTGILPEMQVVPHLDDAIFFLLRAAWQEYMSIWKCLCLFIVEGMAGSLHRFGIAGNN